MNRKYQKGIASVVVPVVLVIFVLVMGVVLYFQQQGVDINTQKSTVSQSFTPVEYREEIQTVRPQDMNYTIEVPSSFNVEEKTPSVILSSVGNEITITRSGTNFDDIDSYISNLSEENNFVLEAKKEDVVNGLSAISGFVGERKSYFIYADGWVYTLSTTSTDLYSDLDQIAKSFRYTPNQK